MPCWLVGFRTDECADHFMADLKPRLLNRVQISTDGMGGYPKAIAKHFGTEVDYAVIIKNYMPPPTTPEAKRRYSPNKVIGTTVSVVEGAPDHELATTSHIERANLSMRMGMRRFTRLTNDFVKVHGSIKTTPAMKAGVTSFQWTMEDILMMTDTME